jgi:hypothetical protein
LERAFPLVDREAFYVLTGDTIAAIVLENEEDFSFSSVINTLSQISDTMQNLWWLFGLLFMILVLAFSLFSINRKTNKYTRKVIQRLINDGKYIPEVFVELNDSKEILRYFIYSKKWKKRLIGSYNFVYDNAYGDILKKACDNTSMCFRLKRKASQKEVMDVVNAAYELHNNLRKSDVEFKSDYKESQVLFEILHYPYTEALGSLVQYCKAANGKYLILTGSAGNGKTNLLCSISELLINLKEATIFLNSRDIEGDILDFLLSELELPDLYVKHKEIYLYLVNLLLTMQHKHGIKIYLSQ